MIGAGTANLFVPLENSRGDRRRREPERKRWGENGGPCLYSLYPRGRRAPARRFTRACSRAGWGVYEDPATGRAAAAFAGVVMAYEPPGDGEHMLMIEQGIEMGRPSFISLGLEVEGGRLARARRSAARR